MSTKLTVKPEEPPPDFPLLDNNPYRCAGISRTLGGNGRGGPPGYG